MSRAKFGDVFSTTAKVLISLFLIFLGVGVIYRIVFLPANYLFAAYAVTWIIHIVYLSTIVSRYSRLRREIEDLNKK